MNDLQVDLKKSEETILGVKYPVAIPLEVRKRTKICPKIRRTVTVLECFQCAQYELLDDKERRRVGRCLFEEKRSPSKRSRRLTKAFHEQAYPLPLWKKYNKK